MVGRSHIICCLNARQRVELGTRFGLSVCDADGNRLSSDGLRRVLLQFWNEHPEKDAEIRKFTAEAIVGYEICAAPMESLCLESSDEKIHLLDTPDQSPKPDSAIASPDLSLVREAAVNVPFSPNYDFSPQPHSLSVGFPALSLSGSPSHYPSTANVANSDDRMASAIELVNRLYALGESTNLL